MNIEESGDKKGVCQQDRQKNKEVCRCILHSLQI